ncbi:hypothetical protein B0H14DRAFT_2560214 [Mycena olivaceomarginata]|nr:hypothetical protein B0H14DRAFT_2560214 [Mycena olivaceomarginata]
MARLTLPLSVGVHSQPVPKPQASRDIGRDTPFFLNASPGSHIIIAEMGEKQRWYCASSRPDKGSWTETRSKAAALRGEPISRKVLLFLDVERLFTSGVIRPETRTNAAVRARERTPFREKCCYANEYLAHCRALGSPSFNERRRQKKPRSHSASGLNGVEKQPQMPCLTVERRRPKENQEPVAIQARPAPVGVPGYLTQHPLASLSTDSTRIKTPPPYGLPWVWRRWVFHPAPFSVTVDKRRRPKENQADSHSGSTVYGITGYSTQRSWRHC